LRKWTASNWSTNSRVRLYSFISKRFIVQNRWPNFDFES